MSEQILSKVFIADEWDLVIWTLISTARDWSRQHNGNLYLSETLNWKILQCQIHLRYLDKNDVIKWVSSQRSERGQKRVAGINLGQTWQSGNVMAWTWCLILTMTYWWINKPWHLCHACHETWHDLAIVVMNDTIIIPWLLSSLLWRNQDANYPTNPNIIN